MLSMAFFLKMVPFSNNKERIKEAFINHFISVLAKLCMEEVDEGYVELIDCQVLTDYANKMVKDVTTKEIRDTFFAMYNEKALGCDGFNSLFFKTTWDIVS